MRHATFFFAALVMAPNVAIAQDLGDLPAAAKAGECFVEIVQDEQIEWVEQRVIEQPASFESVTHPAVYETVEERVRVKDATTVYKSVPASYETVFETIDVEPGTSVTVAKQKLAEPARLIEEEVPAEYQTILVERLVSPAREERVETPAIYVTIEKPVLTGGTSEWHQILCDDTPRETIADVQTALTAAGYPAAVDGVFGPETWGAMEAYQSAHDLAVGYLTVATVEHLGVSPR